MPYAAADVLLGELFELAAAYYYLVVVRCHDKVALAELKAVILPQCASHVKVLKRRPQIWLPGRNDSYRYKPWIANRSTKLRSWSIQSLMGGNVLGGASITLWRLDARGSRRWWGGAEEGGGRGTGMYSDRRGLSPPRSGGAKLSRNDKGFVGTGVCGGGLSLVVPPLLEKGGGRYYGANFSSISTSHCQEPRGDGRARNRAPAQLQVKEHQPQRQ